MLSRVVPATGETMATSRRASGIDQRGLAGIGRAGDHNGNAIPDAFSPVGIRQKGSNLRDNGVEASARHDKRVRGHISLLGEINGGLDHGETGQQRLLQPVGLAGEPPAVEREGLATLRLRLRLKKIGQAFDLAEVHAAVLEGPAGELSRLRRPDTLNGQDATQHGRDDGPAAMNLEFQHILAGEARRCGKPQEQAPGRGGRRRPDRRASPGLRAVAWEFARRASCRLSPPAGR